MTAELEKFQRIFIIKSSATYKEIKAYTKLPQNRLYYLLNKLTKNGVLERQTLLEDSRVIIYRLKH